MVARGGWRGGANAPRDAGVRGRGPARGRAGRGRAVVTGRGAKGRARLAAREAAAHLRPGWPIPLAVLRFGPTAWLLGRAVAGFTRLEPALWLWLRKTSLDAGYWTGKLGADALLEAEQGWFASATGHVVQALQLDPDWVGGYRVAGWLYRALGRTGSSRIAYERGLRLAPGDPTLHEALGDLEIALGDAAAAERAFRAALDRLSDAHQARRLPRKLRALESAAGHVEPGAWREPGIDPEE